MEKLISKTFRRWSLITFLLTTSSYLALAQGSYIPYDRDYYHRLERYEISKGRNNFVFQTGIKPYRRDLVGKYLDSLTQDSFHRTRVDEFNLAYLNQDNWEFVNTAPPLSKNPFLKALYKRPGDLAYYYSDEFDIHVSPVIYLNGGIEPENNQNPNRLSRGVVLRGSIDKKVGFYTYFTSSEAFFPSWVKNYAEYTGAVPGEGFWKEYNSDGYSYFSALGHVNFNLTKNIQAQVGHDRNFVGEGYRSLILSDFSNPYMFVKLNVNIWKFQWTNIWTQMTADVDYNRGRPTDGRYPQKYYSFHRLALNIGKNLNIGFSESVMTDKINFNYFNPLVFFRWVEQSIGTPDKVIIAFDGKWNLYPGMQLYGQFALDEFVFSEFFGVDGKKSKRNKYGVQLGYKYINAFKISNLDLQLEYNSARPYTYQEKHDHQSYSNWRTPLTHPLGANFREYIGIVRYQPIPKLQLTLLSMYQYYGDDPDAVTNWGKDVLKNRLEGSPTGLFGNEIGQGILNQVVQTNLNASYMLRHNFYIDATHTFRRRTTEDVDSPETKQFFQMGIRWNFMRPDYNY